MLYVTIRLVTVALQTMRVMCDEETKNGKSQVS